MKINSNSTTEKIKDNKTNKELRSFEQISRESKGETQKAFNETEKKDFANILDQTKFSTEKKSLNNLAEELVNKNNSTELEILKEDSTLNSKLSLNEKKKENNESDDHADLSQNRQGFGEIAAKQSQMLSDLQFPSARAILHITDLERIISTIRSQQIGEDKQIVITLKKSVLEGLNLKLTIDKEKKVTAEFIASNQKVKSQLDARSKELAEIMRDRGIKLSVLKTSVEPEPEDKYENE